MPGLLRNLLIIAAVDGLVLQPSQRSNRSPALKIQYGTHDISKLDRHLDAEEDGLASVESNGIIGLLKVSSSAYLISVSRRQQVAQLWGRPVYVIQNVTFIPIQSKADAEKIITHALPSSQQDVDNNDASRHAADDPENDDLTYLDDTWLDQHVRSRPNTSGDPGRRRKSLEEREAGIAQDVIGRKGAYGRFAQRWFSSKGWRTGQLRNQGMSGLEEHSATATPVNSLTSVSSHVDSNAASVKTLPSGQDTVDHRSAKQQDNHKLTNSLLPKLVSTTRLLFNSQTFFYSYDDDITRSIQTSKPTSSDISLHKQVDPEFFWNAHLSLPFMESGCDEYVLPVMQGFVGQRSFTVGETAKQVQDSTVPVNKVLGAKTPGDDKENYFDKDEMQVSDSREFLLTLISRRRTKRAGLRFHRRGIDEDGNTANTVETEQILSSPSWGPKEEVQSFIQTRGSIPLFFSQSPYTPKPVPILHGSFESNHRAFVKHFTQLSNRYGKVQAVTLLDQTGGEANVGQSYEKHVQQLNQEGGVNGSSVGFEWFDFHTACRGMKFENVSKLVDHQSTCLKDYGWTRKSQQNNVSQPQVQTGVVRTNCMDCLDRTNVVQAAFAQNILEQQLATSSAGDYSINLTDDPNTTWFNTLWADNGDAISRAYAGTSALKGDYTRTRRRNFRGALTDFTLSVTRYYQNLFNDFFGQAAIDYLLGTVTEAVFTEFEAKMTSVDPAIDLRKARQAAIMTSAKVIVDEHEDLLSGWAMAAPAVPNSLRALPFKEALLLLTDRALYAIRYDWDNEKPLGFERVPLDRVNSVQYGTFITETMASAQTDPIKNVGLVVRFSSPAGRPSLVRVNTRSLDNLVGVPVLDDTAQTEASGQTAPTIGKIERDSAGREQSRIIAFKALPNHSTVVRDDPDAVSTNLSEKDFVKQVCEEIASAVNKHASKPKGDSSKAAEEVEEGQPASMTGQNQQNIVVEEQDIVSLEEAKRSTGYLDHIEYSLKRFVWG